MSKGTDNFTEIPGCNGYGAAPDGQIINLSTGLILAQRPSGSGNMQVNIGKSTRMVHDLVARAYYGHPLCRGYRVRHWNGDRRNNHVGNLMWAGVPREPVIKEPPRQSAPFAPAFQRAYEDAVSERESLLVLMQPW